MHGRLREREEAAPSLGQPNQLWPPRRDQSLWNILDIWKRSVKCHTQNNPATARKCFLFQSPVSLPFCSLSWNPPTSTAQTWEVQGFLRSHPGCGRSQYGRRRRRLLQGETKMRGRTTLPVVVTDQFSNGTVKKFQVTFFFF